MEEIKIGYTLKTRGTESCVIIYSEKMSPTFALRHSLETSGIAKNYCEDYEEIIKIYDRVQVKHEGRNLRLIADAEAIPNSERNVNEKV